MVHQLSIDDDQRECESGLGKEHQVRGPKSSAMSLAVELSKRRSTPTTNGFSIEISDLGPDSVARVARHHQLISGALFIAALIVLCIFPSFDRRSEQAYEAEGGQFLCRISMKIMTSISHGHVELGMFA